MIKYVSNNIELNNDKKGNRYVYYPLRDGDSHRIVMCIENQDGFRPVKSDLLIRKRGENSCRKHEL